MQLIDHRNIGNTIKYTKLVNFQRYDYTCRVAIETEKIKGLIARAFKPISSTKYSTAFEKISC